MAWTAIPATDLDPESPITTSLMNALYDNVAAAFARDAGAPAVAANFISSSSQLAANVVTATQIASSAVGASEIAANAVGMSQLNTTIGADSSYVISSLSAVALSPAGWYLLYDSTSSLLLQRYIWNGSIYVWTTEHSFSGSTCIMAPLESFRTRIYNPTGGNRTIYYTKMIG